jgi:hypothetical protein
VIHEFLKRRRMPFPEKLLLTEMQTMEYIDSRFFLSPYVVVKQQILYLLETKRIVSYDKIDGS